jgi:hypothetical protein
MDTGEGRFEELDIKDHDELRQKYPKSRGIFAVGEEVKLKDLIFKIKKITAFSMSLRYINSNNIQLGSPIPLFSIDEEIEIKTSNFKIIDVFPKGIKLKLLNQ